MFSKGWQPLLPMLSGVAAVVAVAVVVGGNKTGVCHPEPLGESRMRFVSLPTSEAREARGTQKRHGYTQKLSVQIPLEPLNTHPSFFASQPHMPLPRLLCPACMPIYLASALHSEGHPSPPLSP